MKSIRKLTPRILKQLIAEERKNISKQKKVSSKKSRKKISANKVIKEIKQLKNKQKILLREFKKAQRRRLLMKKKLLKGL